MGHVGVRTVRKRARLGAIPGGGKRAVWGADLPRALPDPGCYELNQLHRGWLDMGSLDLRAFSAPIAGRHHGLVEERGFHERPAGTGSCRRAGDLARPLR